MAILLRDLIGQIEQKAGTSITDPKLTNYYVVGIDSDENGYEFTEVEVDNDKGVVTLFTP